MKNLKLALKKKESELYIRLERIVITEPQSLAQVAKDIGVTSGTIYNFIKGKHRASIKFLLLLEQYIKRKEKNLGLIE